MKTTTTTEGTMTTITLTPHPQDAKLLRPHTAGQTVHVDVWKLGNPNPYAACLLVPASVIDVDGNDSTVTFTIPDGYGLHEAWEKSLDATSQQEV